jgi:transposase
MTRRRLYPSDLSDARWELIEPTLTTRRPERRGKGLAIGRPPEHDLRRIMDAVLYVDRTGIPWRYLLHDFAPWETVYGHFAAWQKEGVFDQLKGLLSRLVREAEVPDGEPTACVLDAQSVKTSANVPATGQGIDPGKKIAGRKRHIGVDTLGLLLAVWVSCRAIARGASTAGPERPSRRRSGFLPCRVGVWPVESGEQRVACCSPARGGTGRCHSRLCPPISSCLGEHHR